MLITDDYIKFLSNCKTERECVAEAEKLALQKGFLPFNQNSTYHSGDKVYFINRKKNFAAFIIGENPEYNILGAHIDSPRIDVKQSALTENDDIAYFDTHYYGGIKKYQWVTTPLALHGVVVKKDGTPITIKIGEDKNDQVFCITDLLPHLDSERMSTQKADEFVKGENLDVIAGVVSKKDSFLRKDIKDLAKTLVLNILKDKYNIEEDDFYSAELEFVPAAKASYCGLDKSLVAGYGQDDRVCAYTSLRAILDYNGIPKNTACVVLVDKEEIGSCSNTGAHSDWFETCLYKVMTHSVYTDEGAYEMFKNILSNSNMLSSDVTAAYDPLYADAYSKHTSAKLGYGMMLSKYNGARGKAGSNDATPEYIAKLRKHFDGELFQFDEMGKVDQGGGGTIASIYCNFNMNVIDAGVPVLNMHSPMELAHVDDIESAYKCYKKFIDMV